MALLGKNILFPQKYKTSHAISYTCEHKHSSAEAVTTGVFAEEGKATNHSDISLTSVPNFSYGNVSIANCTLCALRSAT